MKILHAAETIKGGVATVMRTLALAQAGKHQVEALVPANQADEMRPFTNLRTFNRTGRNPASILSFAKQFAAAVLHMRPDVVHLHSTFAGVIGRIVLIGLWPLHRPRVVYCPHAWAFLMEGSATKKRAYALIERLLYPFTTHIVCVSRFEADEAARFNLPTKRISVIYNGTPSAPSTTLPNPYTNPKAINLLFVGRLDYQKGFDVLLAAMQRLEDTDIHLTVIGDTVHGAQKPPARTNITYTGWLKSNELAPYFQHATAVVVPSRWEGFAMVPLEAMSHGKAVIATRVSSLPEVITPGETGLLFTLGDAAELALLLRKTTPASWAKMGTAAKALHTAKFTSGMMISATEKRYTA